MSKHKHKFTLPVEWDYYYSKEAFDQIQDLLKKGSLKNKDSTLIAFDRKKVIKLRCECGEEWIRSDNE